MRGDGSGESVILLSVIDGQILARPTLLLQRLRFALVFPLSQVRANRPERGQGKPKQCMNSNHGVDGKFSEHRVIKKRGFGKWETAAKYTILAIGTFVVAFHYIWYVEQPLRASNEEMRAAMVEVAEAAEIPAEPTLSVEVLEKKLIDIVWHGESRKYVPKDGEILKVFDPSSSTYAKCIQQFNRDLDCMSWGPMQIKIGTLQFYYPKVYGTEITQREALDIALDLEKSQRFFVDCSVQIKGCANNWTAFVNHKAEGQIFIDLIREAKGINL